MGLGMELHAEVRPNAGANALVGSVVDVDEPWLPIGRKGGILNRVPMILARDVTTPREQVLHGLIHAAMSVGQFVGIAARGEAEDLVTQANPKNRFFESTE
jgi:hypothetical protein